MRERGVLGIDAATAHASVAVTHGDAVVSERDEGPDPEGRPRHSEVLLPAVERCVAEGGGWGVIGLIAVGIGPGSYTGLRIGIATARALAQARRIPIAGVVTLAAIARGIRERPEAEGRPALAALDARRGQASVGLYDQHGSERREPSLAGPEELAEIVSGLRPSPVAGGEGSLRFGSTLEAAGATVLPAGDPAHRVAARHVCALGAQAEASSPERIEPIYLRPPDAKNWIERERPKPAQ